MPVSTLKNKLKICDVLQELIREKDLTVSELARQINIPQPTLQRIVSGNRSRPHQKTLESLAAFFNISIGQLRGLEPITWLKDNLLIRHLPIIDPIQALKWPNISEKDFKHIVIDKKVSDQSYAMQMPDASMEPLIPKNSILIIDPEKQPNYRSFVVVKIKNYKEILIRQLIKDANNLYVRPLSHDFEQFNMTVLTNEDSILGVIVEVRLNCD
ncbi:MAG: LexA family transcriptional regulator [Gammaproteobacteria bacterium]|nr:MAG: LexA family transcriptional regulator [Gammaproteobacteria bacterium]